MNIKTILTLAFWPLWITASVATAVEFVDGDNEPVTVLNGMHSCPQGFLVTGVHVDRNLLLCAGYFGNFLQFPARQDWGVTATNQFSWPGLPNMHWCGPGNMVRGVHVAGNGFNCQTFDTATKRLVTIPLGTPYPDRGTNPTVRSGMHACPRGSILVGAHFATNTFVCAPLGFCAVESNEGCPTGKRCVARTPNSLIGSCQ